MAVIAPEVAPRAALIPDELIPDDPFHDAKLKWVWLSLVLMAVAGVFVLSGVYLVGR